MPFPFDAREDEEPTFSCDPRTGPSVLEGCSRSTVTGGQQGGYFDGYAIDRWQAGGSRTVQVMAITEITRRALTEQIMASPYSWTGDLDEVRFLERLYPLDDLPSTDSRLSTARNDIIQHCIANLDWEEDWIFADDRFQIGSSDEHLLNFLAATVHPAVRTDATACRELAGGYNRLLRFDGVQLAVKQHVSGRPIYGPERATPPAVTPMKLQDSIAEVIWRELSATRVAEYCEGLGLGEPFDDYDDPMSSKRAYVRAHTKGLGVAELVAVAESVLADFDDAELRSLVLAARQQHAGVAGPVKNLIFAADGPKPELVLRDAINNTIEITKYAEYCLVYDRPLGDSGLSWRDLVAWWSEDQPATSEVDCARALHRRLLRSVSADSPGEQILFSTYARFYGTDGFDLPALIPQVYLHLDPRTRRTVGDPLVRQRMDFLLLLPARRRVVIEVDGQHHYAEDGRPSSRLYAEMMREDRQLRLAGYEVFRFGAAELTGSDAAVDVVRFFKALLSMHGIELSGPTA